MPYPFIESPNRTPVARRPIDLVVIHTMEAPERGDTAEAVARWFAREDVAVAAHYCVDADSVVQCVREQDIAWHARGGNTRSIGIELAGYARQGDAEWDDPYSRSLLTLAASLAAEICTRHRVPVRRLGATAVRTGRRGLTGHNEVSLAFGRSDHWDPGPAFPWETFLALVEAAQRERPPDVAGALADLSEPAR
ncbi:MAG: N-acetylmuramoyl-L-alanine amidase [Gaiella sp.]